MASNIAEASTGAMANLLNLPPELLLQIAKCMHFLQWATLSSEAELSLILTLPLDLEPKDLTQLQRACKKLRPIGRDSTLWLEHCFEGSYMYESVWLPRLQNTENNDNSGDGDDNNNDNNGAIIGGTHHGPNQPPLNPNHLTPQMILQMVAQGNLPHGIPPGAIHHALQHLHHHMHQPPPAIQLAMQHLQNQFPPGPAAAQPPTTDQDGGQSDGQGSETSNQDDEVPRNSKQERLRIRANWDPSYPNEGVSWYDEYIHRHAPTVVNWFEPARRRDANGRWANIEARGVALYRPDNPMNTATGLDTLLALSPLDDGSICIWDVNGTSGKKGSVVAKSKPGLLFVDGPQGDNNRASKRVDSGVTECVSVDNQRHRAFFAVQSRESSQPCYVIAVY